jgi:hypothetical protein
VNTRDSNRNTAPKDSWGKNPAEHEEVGTPLEQTDARDKKFTKPTGEKPRFTNSKKDSIY